MMKNELLSKKIIALEIIQTIIQHSDDNYLLRIALTEKLRDLLGCKLVVFAQYNIFSVEEDLLSFEYAPDTLSRSQLEKDVISIYGELKEFHTCITIKDFKKECISFSKFSEAIILPINHQNMHIGTIVIFDIIQLYDMETIISAIESLVPYISIVLFNTISYHQMENIINIRTSELKKAIKQVNDSNKAKSLFLANMSHEMRTPLNGIIGFAELLVIQEDQPEKLNYLKKIQSASKSLLHLISEVLDLSKIEFDNIELYESPFDLSTVIEDVHSLHAEKAREKGITFNIQSSNMPKTKVLGDLERFKQILNNLISNSIKFTAIGSVDINVETETERIEIDNEVVETRLKFICDVVDTGKGINPENINRIFEVFTQEDASTTREYGGTGLGLSIVKKLIELMDGDIHVDSQVGYGSVFSFYVYFTLLDEVASLDESNDTLFEIYSCEQKNQQANYENRMAWHVYKTENNGTPSLSVLVVEDNEINSNLIGEILKLKEIDPDFAKNGKEALTMSGKKDYDIIFMDCQMPIMDGFNATREIRKYYNDFEYPYLKSPYIIALTAAVSDTDRKACYDAGMNDFMTKPINLNTINKKIDLYSEKYLDI